MSTYNTSTKHLCISRARGIRRSIARSDQVLQSWHQGTVQSGFADTFPVLVRYCSNSEFPILFKPIQRIPCAEFDEFFGFRAGDYDHARVVAVDPTSVTCVPNSMSGQTTEKAKLQWGLRWCIR